MSQDKIKAEAVDQEDDESIPIEAANLLATLVQANADSLNHVTNQLMEAYQRERDEFAEALVGLWDVIQDAEVLDRTTQRKLWKFAGKVGAAEGVIQFARSQQ